VDLDFEGSGLSRYELLMLHFHATVAKSIILTAG
jgi:hypothetical protein